ncbi:unnamed protein product [Nippostrongylus brasiliensis]|uniref:Uncharacterized protein n=1 Tax=Nippostrongylus brasiliensis TaxID=27835 RepID=A0A0N4XVA2_NIPBR|nr:unnamed protein product [Nippostrongylus brasiliensis]
MTRMTRMMMMRMMMIGWLLTMPNPTALRLCHRVTGPTHFGSKERGLGQIHKGKCGPPDNFNSLPDYAQEEIKDLWSTYVPGTLCLKELAIQQDVLNLVDTFSRDLSTQKRTTERRRYIVPAATTPAEFDEYSLYENDLLATSFPRLIGSESQFIPRKKSSIDRNYDEATIDDIATMQFNNGQASFLRTVPSAIQTLAVSLLTAKQLEEYNRWATKRRYVLKAREQELNRDEEKVPVPASVKRELRNFVVAFNRRRAKVLSQ